MFIIIFSKDCKKYKSIFTKDNSYESVVTGNNKLLTYEANEAKCFWKSF